MSLLPYKNISSGFTIIESLVAISILLVVISGPLALANSSLSQAVFSKQQLVASYLAGDALDYMRWVRDSRAEFSTFLSDVGAGTNCMENAPCGLDTTKEVLTVAIKNSCASSACVLNYDSTNHYYTHDPVDSTVSVTSYTRSMVITKITDDDDEVRIQVTVAWVSALGDRVVVLNENLLNWK